jgi:hypothetical protein
MKEAGITGDVMWRIRYWWQLLGPWQETSMDDPTPIYTLVGPPTPLPRSIGHIEADLVIQGVLVTRARLRGSNDLEQERARLDQLLDEWQAARAATQLSQA